MLAFAVVGFAACGDGNGATDPAPAATIASVDISHSTVTMAKLQDIRLVASAKDQAGNTLDGRTITWTSSDPSVATVENGTVTARQRGSAVVIAAAEGKADSAVVNVLVLTSIATGVEESCAISEAGRLYCAGDRFGARGRVIAPAVRFKSVTLGANNTGFSCAIDVDDQLLCWGENGHGQLGVGDTLARTEPTRVAGTLRFSSVALGRGHTCGVTPEGAAYCWGRGTEGQLGAGEFRSSTTPVRVSGNLQLRQVTAGRFYSCGLTAEGRIFCWGENEAGHLGIGSTTDSSSPVEIQAGNRRFRAITGGGAACGLDLDGLAFCWGDNTLFKLGAATTEKCFGNKPCSTVPVAVEGNHRFTLIRSSNFATCALDPAGTVYCWGMNMDGKFGTSVSGQCNAANAPAPCTRTPVAGPDGFLSLSSGPTNNCGMHRDGGAYCWGGNASGQLGRPDVKASAKPLAFSLDPGTQP